MANINRGRCGPRTVYDRTQTETIRVSPLWKRIIAACAADASRASGRRISVGDFVEHLGRTRARRVSAREFRSR